MMIKLSSREMNWATYLLKGYPYISGTLVLVRAGIQTGASQRLALETVRIVGSIVQKQNAYCS